LKKLNQKKRDKLFKRSQNFLIHRQKFHERKVEKISFKKYIK